jgi:hypothetical protein
MPSFFTFRVVTTLALPNNNLQGTIPSDIQLLTTLRRLDLSKNPGLVGTIPPELGSFRVMKELYLSDTSLGGSIPSTFEGLDRLGTSSPSGVVSSLHLVTKAQMLYESCCICCYIIVGLFYLL